MVQKGPEWLVKIGDFGMSKRINENSSLRTMRGTQAFLAPEMLGILPPEEEEGSLSYHYTESVDMWALGVTIFYLLFHEYPFSLKQPNKLPRYIWGADFPFPISPSQKFSPQCYRFIEAVMARNPKKRLSSRKALEGEWLKQCYSSPAPSPLPTPSLETIVLNIPTRKSSRDSSQASSTVAPDCFSPSLEDERGDDMHEAITNHDLDRSPDSDIRISRVTGETPLIDPLLDGSIENDAQSMSSTPNREADFSADQSNSSTTIVHSEDNLSAHENLSPMRQASQADSVNKLSGPLAELDFSMYLPNFKSDVPVVTSQSEYDVEMLLDPYNIPTPSSVSQALSQGGIVRSTDNPSLAVNSLQPKNSFAEPFSSQPRGRRFHKEGNDKTHEKLDNLQMQGMKMLKEDNCDGAEKLLQQVLNVRKQLLGTKHEATLESYHTLGALRYKKMEYSTASALFELAADGRKEILGQKHPDTMSSFYWLGDTQFELGLFEDAELVLRQNADDRASTIGFSNPKTLQTNHILGLSLWAQRKWDEALSILEPVVEERQDSLGRTHPDTASSLFWTGYSFYKLEIYEKAILALEGALFGQKEALGLANNETIRTISIIGRSLYHLGEWEKARAALQEATSLNQMEPNGTTLHVLYLLGRSLLYLKRYEEASRVLQEAAEGQKKVLGPTHPETLWSLYRLGRSFLDLDRFGEAAATFQKAVTGGIETFGPDHPETLDSLSRLGVAQCKLKFFEKAKDTLQRAIEGQLKTLGPHDLSALDSLFWLGCSLHQLKLYDEAEATYRKSLALEVEIYGRARSSTLCNIDSLGWVYYRDGEYTKAEKLTGLLIGCRMETNGSMHTRTLDAKRLLALTLQEEGHMERALSLHSEVLRDRVELLGPQHKYSLQSSRDVGKCQSEMLETERNRVNETWNRSREYYLTELPRESSGEEGKDEKRNWIDMWARVKRRMSKTEKNPNKII